MGLASKKIINSAMAAAGLLLFAYGYYLNHRSSNNQQESTLAQEIVAHEARINAQGDNHSPIDDQAAEQSNVNTADKRPAKLELPEYQELVRWDNERGYVSGEDYQIYQSYSEQTLKDLSASGDIKAMLALGMYYIQKEDRPEDSNAQFHKAAVYGATVALTHLASQAQMDMIATEADKTTEGREQGVIDIMAHYKVEAMRGDHGGSVANINAYKEVYKVRYGQEQLDKIDLRAKAIYDELLQRRRELGLGDFDNSTPDVLQRNNGAK